MVYGWDTDNKTGADCTGSTGDKNRILTVDNTGLTKQGGFLVTAGLTLGLGTEYTVVHSATGSTITFLNKMFDYMTIVVKYLQASTATNNYEIARNDIQGIIIENGISATLIRQTKTTDGLGGLTGISTENYAIFLVVNDITKKDRQIIDMGLAVHGNKKAFFIHEYVD